MADDQSSLTLLDNSWSDAVIYVKSALAGVVTALAAIVIVVFVMTRAAVSDGGGAVFVMVGSWQILTAAVVGFSAGFWLTLRRSHIPRR